MPTPFNPGSEKKKGEGLPKICFDLAENQTAVSLEVSANRYTRISYFVKTLMGLEPFEVRIFIREKLTKFHLALTDIMKN